MTRAWTRSCAACSVRKDLIFLMWWSANLQDRAVFAMCSLKVSWPPWKTNQWDRTMFMSLPVYWSIDDFPQSSAFDSIIELKSKDGIWKFPLVIMLSLTFSIVNVISSASGTSGTVIITVNICLVALFIIKLLCCLKKTIQNHFWRYHTILCIL